MFDVLVACDQHFGIGKDGGLPWTGFGADMAWFKTKSIGNGIGINAVIMGRKTWESLPGKLADRANIVISSSAPDCAFHGAVRVSSFEAAVEYAEQAGFANTFVIGGSRVYDEAMGDPRCRNIFLTMVDDVFECDTRIKSLDPKQFTMRMVLDSGNKPFQWYRYLYTRRTPKYCGEGGERQYLKLVESIVDEGVYRMDRTGTGAYSKFGVQMRFDLRGGTFPLLTTKRMFWRGIVEELIWFVNGETDSRLLSDKGVKFWDQNGSKEFLESRGLQNEEGDLGPVYGFQWRHFGAEYKGPGQAKYAGQGVDQIKALIDGIKADPSSRRHLVSAWNPVDIDKMALPPCHVLSQFWVCEGELYCQLYQRSGDIGLGVPFNIASYALLTCIVAKLCSLKPAQLVHVIGDAHVYADHVKPLIEQTMRAPGKFPTLRIKDGLALDDLKFEDFLLEGYAPQQKISMELSA